MLRMIFIRLESKVRCLLVDVSCLFSVQFDVFIDTLIDINVCWWVF